MYQKRSVYFDFDQSALKPEFMPVVEMHGKFLSTHPNVFIKVEGNTDEQGGAEYNLALGQKRAQVVANALKLYGARDSQLEAISFGKEKPKALGHDDDARAQNRRVDLAYPAR
jgi:peptidoglycan-associated lipoprotein